MGLFILTVKISVIAQKGRANTEIAPAPGFPPAREWRKWQVFSSSSCPRLKLPLPLDSRLRGNDGNGKFSLARHAREACPRADGERASRSCLPHVIEKLQISSKTFWFY